MGPEHSLERHQDVFLCAARTTLLSLALCCVVFGVIRWNIPTNNKQAVRNIMRFEQPVQMIECNGV
jgi:hypothetical protein